MYLFLLKVVLTSVLAATVPLANALQERSTRSVSHTDSTTNKSSSSYRSNGILKLGYLTGSLRAESNFYDKPGQLISGAITMAVTEINKTPEVSGTE